MIFGEHFEWDEAKEAGNLAKHGVSFLEAVAAFADPARVILPDLGHSRTEPRWHCLGRVGDSILTVLLHRTKGPRPAHWRGLLAQRQTTL